jgi:hypothetical protein
VQKQRWFIFLMCFLAVAISGSRVGSALSIPLVAFIISLLGWRAVTTQNQLTSSSNALLRRRISHVA